jgi:peptide/nickel transport system permease protein
MAVTTLADETSPPEAAAIGLASQRELVWLKFNEHKLAVVSLYVIGLIYLIGAFCEFVAPRTPDYYDSAYTMLAPQPLRLFHTDEDGNTQFGLHVNGFSSQRDPQTLRRVFTLDENIRIPVGFFVEGEAYRMWGFIPMNRHLIGPVNPQDPFYLLGSDRLGRDVLSRTVYGTRVSTSIGLIGVAISLVLGIILGGISGYFGGADRQHHPARHRVHHVGADDPAVDGAGGGDPADLVIRWLVYFIITIIMSLIGWTSLAREVRGKVHVAGERGLRHRRAARRHQPS